MNPLRFFRASFDSGRASPIARRWWLAGCAVTAATAFAADSPAAGPSAPLQSADDYAVYTALGSALAQKMHLDHLEWNEARFTAFISGLRAEATGHASPANETAQRLLAQITGAPGATAAAESDPVAQFLRQARQQLQMQQGASGLLWRITVAGTGPHARPIDTVVVDLAAKNPAGGADLPQLSGQKMRLKVAELPPGLAEGIQMLGLGAKAIFILPATLSFGDGPWPEGIARGTPILVEVSLDDIIPARD